MQFKIGDNVWVPSILGIPQQVVIKDIQKDYYLNKGELVAIFDDDLSEKTGDMYCIELTRCYATKEAYIEGETKYFDRRKTENTNKSIDTKTNHKKQIDTKKDVVEYLFRYLEYVKTHPYDKDPDFETVIKERAEKLFGIHL